MRQGTQGFCSDEVAIAVEEVGVRPASKGPRTDELERMASVSCDVIRSITGEEPVDRPSSTDANIPLSLGIPANTLGAVRGALLHTRDEWVGAASVEEGLAVTLGVMLVQGCL